MTHEDIRSHEPDDPAGALDGSTISETETGSAGPNVAYPRPSSSSAPGGASKVTDGDVPDMNADSSTQGGDDAVPGVRSG